MEIKFVVFTIIVVLITMVVSWTIYSRNTKNDTEVNDVVAGTNIPISEINFVSNKEMVLNELQLLIDKLLTHKCWWQDIEITEIKLGCKCPYQADLVFTNMVNYIEAGVFSVPYSPSTGLPNLRRLTWCAKDIINSADLALLQVPDNLIYLDKFLQHTATVNIGPTTTDVCASGIVKMNCNGSLETTPIWTILANRKFTLQQAIHCGMGYAESSKVLKDILENNTELHSFKELSGLVVNLNFPVLYRGILNSNLQVYKVARKLDLSEIYRHTEQPTRVFDYVLTGMDEIFSWSVDSRQYINLVDLADMLKDLDWAKSAFEKIKLRK